MDALLYQHGCENSFRVPEGLKELMSDITREVLRSQPKNITYFIANYLSCLLITREHGMVALKIVEDLCDCSPTLSEELFAMGMDKDDAKEIADIIRDEIKSHEATPGTEQVAENQIAQTIMDSLNIPTKMRKTLKCIIKKTFRRYWYRKKILEQSIVIKPNEPWTFAAERTLQLFKRTKPSYSELQRAAERIQVAYTSYHQLRPHTLHNLKEYIITTPPRESADDEAHDSYDNYFENPPIIEEETNPEQRIIEQFISEKKKGMIIIQKTPHLTSRFLLDDTFDDEEPATSHDVSSGGLKLGVIAAPGSAQSIKNTHILGDSEKDEKVSKPRLKVKGKKKKLTKKVPV